MPCYVGLDASKTTTHICVLDEAGRTLEEGFTDSEPKAIITFLRGKRRRYARVGLEAWSLASWLHAGLVKAGLPVTVIEAFHAHGVLSAARRNKTDCNDARGIAELMRRGAYKAVHVKALESQDIKAQLTVRKLLLTKARDVENGIHGVLLLHGLKLRARAQRNLRASCDGSRRTGCASSANLIAPLAGCPPLHSGGGGPSSMCG